MLTHALEGGFANPPAEAAYAFRNVMSVLARPGDIRAVSGAKPPAPLSVAAGVVLLTLCDPDTPVYLSPQFDQPDVREWIRFHTGAPFAPATAARFAFGKWENLPIADFPVGVSEYPDRSATLVLELPVLQASGARLSGPGIQSQAQLSLPEVAPFQANHALFPLGLDFFFTCGDLIAGLPRSTEVR